MTVVDMLTEEEALARLQQRVARFPTKGAAAEAFGLSQQYIGDVLHKRRPLGDRLLAVIGLRRAIVETRR